MSILNQPALHTPTLCLDIVQENMNLINISQYDFECYSGDSGQFN